MEEPNKYLLEKINEWYCDDPTIVLLCRQTMINGNHLSLNRKKEIIQYLYEDCDDIEIAGAIEWLLDKNGVLDVSKLLYACTSFQYPNRILLLI